MSRQASAGSRRVPRAASSQTVPEVDEEPGAPSTDEAEQTAALFAQSEQLAEARRREAEASRSSQRTSRASPRLAEGDDGTAARKVVRRANAFDMIPENLKKPGWDYQWWAIRVFNEAVDPSRLVEIADGGWKRVHPSDMPGMMPPGWDKDFIEKGAQVLYMRPMRLTEEARAEDTKIAEDQRYDRIRNALAGPAELKKIAPRVEAEIDIYGSVVTSRRREE